MLGKIGICTLYSLQDLRYSQLYSKLNPIFDSRGKKVSIRDNKVSIRDNKVSTRDNKVSIRDNKVSIRDNKVSIRDNKVSIRDNKVSIRDNEVSIRDNKVSIRDNKVSIRDNKVSIRDNKVSIRDNKVSIRDNKVSIRDKKVSIRDNKVGFDQIKVKKWQKNYTVNNCSFINLYFYKSFCLFICLSINLSVYLFIYLCMYLFICISIYLSAGTPGVEALELNGQTVNFGRTGPAAPQVSYSINLYFTDKQCLGSGSVGSARFWLPGSGSAKICGCTDPNPRDKISAKNYQKKFLTLNEAPKRSVMFNLFQN